MAAGLNQILTVVPRRMILSRCVFAAFVMCSTFAASAPAPPANCNSAAAGCRTTPGSYGDGEDSLQEIAESAGGSGPYDFPSVTTADGCCAACKNNTDCNVWQFCGQSEGCCDSRDDVTGCTSQARTSKNTCTLLKATGYYHYRDLKPTFFNGSGHYAFVSGKLDNRAPKKEIHPPAVPNEWKCSIPYYCTFLAPGDCGNDNSTTCAPSACNPERGLYGQDAKIVNHEVNSFGYSGGPNHPPEVTDAASCCSACKSSKQCNVWNYCWDPLGCGEPQSCTAYTTLYPPTGGIPNPVRGQFASACTVDGRFPRYFCILRHATGDLKNLTASGSQGFYSWTSGTKQA